jgi:hypothetical protein
MSAPPSPRPINSAAASVRIAPLAYVKAILHACAHPARPVLGVLLASKSGEVVDVVPAFHSNPLAPSLEIAFLLIEEFALRRELSIAGVYAGNELDSDGAALTAWPRLVGEKIAEQTNSVPHALMVLGNLAHFFSIAWNSSRIDCVLSLFRSDSKYQIGQK